MGTSFDIILYISFSIFLVGFLFQTLRGIELKIDKYSNKVVRYSTFSILFTTIGTLGETIFFILAFLFKEEIKISLIISYVFLLLNCLSVIISYINDKDRIKENKDIGYSIDEDGVIYVDGVVQNSEEKQNNIFITSNDNNE